MSSVLIHRTRETGHEHESRRADIDAEVLDRLQAALADALRSGAVVALQPTRWGVQAREDSGRLRAVLSFGTIAVVSLTVTRGRGDAPALVESGVSGLTKLGLGPDAMEAAVQAGDLGRCVGHAWLALGEGLADA